MQSRYQGIADTIVQLFARQTSGVIPLYRPIESDCALRATKEKDHENTDGANVARRTRQYWFLVEDELMRLGTIFEKRADWQSLSVVDGRLITGQNPASSTVAAQKLIDVLAAVEKAA